MSFIHVSEMPRPVYPVKCPVLVCLRRKCYSYLLRKQIHHNPFMCNCAVPCGKLYTVVHSLVSCPVPVCLRSRTPYMLSIMWYSLYDMSASCLLKKQNFLYMLSTMWYSLYNRFLFVSETELPIFMLRS